MSKLLYTIAVILVVFWAIKFIGYNAGGFLHILLVTAFILIVIKVIHGRKIV